MTKAMKADRPYTDQDHRAILDKYLQGGSIKLIAALMDRTPEAIESVLSKIKRDYTEFGKRTSMLTKLAHADPLIETDMPLSRWTAAMRGYFKECHAEGRNIVQMTIIFNCKMKTIAAMEKAIFGGFGRIHRLQDELKAREGSCE